ncbi:hypothetical protein LOZ12_002517 [Ophidiomyces ophidiicola]|uniref:Uncharacterized protein n=1 Tax=Ophidiomyces ophidiicola TaxID=1387563 RepID=A0ACB8V1V0_9EURO|nr:hypothetical protein LOZ62_001814 [Ophidiomyces ophidiicola]KAI1973060.1 hypothetical protein LOZ56_002105 [Ophidiomyces ophidiicola]KAI2006872.1 hypothetical protein LOZ50_002914 [Ophidiomyces ophidiicola]KAI2008296.1 hypothetical protein LOZ46_006645 [Ophidiomyces ophidiicola]KAI2026653.1 hypothetical protein LOZ45_002880 [Ophidiomyces ophidiicola]
MDRKTVVISLSSLLPKFSDPDPDIRYMSLNDLHDILVNPNSSFLPQEQHYISKVSEGLLKALEDQHGEVQNQALKCFSPLARRVPPPTLSHLIQILCELTDSETIDTSVPNTALRAILTALPHPTIGTAVSSEAQTCYIVVSTTLLPRLVGSGGDKSMIVGNGTKGYSNDAIDVLVEVVRSFGPLLDESQLADIQRTMLDIIENKNAGTVATKRALSAISVLAVYFSDSQLSHLVSMIIEGFRSSHLTTDIRRHLIATVSTLGKSIPSKFSPFLKTLAPFVLSAVSVQGMEDMEEGESDSEDDPKEDELRETALGALDILITYCTNDMQPYLMDSIAAALRYLKYDPNVAEFEDEEMGGTQDEGSDDGDTQEPEEGDNDGYEDFEEEEGYSDIDDLSWKVRRSSAKLLCSIISTQGQTSSNSRDDGVVYQKIATAVLSRFAKEREENVKLEVITTMIGLVKRAGEMSASVGAAPFLSKSQTKASRKRRRQDSEGHISDYEPEITHASSALDSPVVTPPLPQTAALGEVMRLTPGIVQGVVKLWKRAMVPLRQAAIHLLKSLALVRYGGLADYLQRIEDPIADALKSSGGGGSATAGATAATAGNLQIDTLNLIATIAETHASNGLLPFLIALVPGVIMAVEEKNYKVASESLGAIEEIIKAMTPPRVSPDDQDLGPQLDKLYDVVINRIMDNSADLEVRQRALHVIGVLLARTSGPLGTKFLSSLQRAKGLSIIADRLKNETTRVAAARAISNVAAFANCESDISTAWLAEVTLDLGAQLRKSDRALRDASIGALKSLTTNANCRQHYNSKTLQDLTNSFLPLLNASDLHLLTPALIILSKIIPGHTDQLMDTNMIKVLCTVIQGSPSGLALKVYLHLVRVIGEQKAGGPFMNALLQDVGVNGDPSIVGRAIGTLVVFGGSKIGVTSQDFLTELQMQQDVRRKCLALAILGEIGLRLGKKSSLAPKLFISNFDSNSDKVRLSAAVALGSAGANNIDAFLPVILAELETEDSSKYLLLHSLREILQHPESVRADVAPFATRLWEILLAVSDDEDNRVVGAECIGRLALIDPKAYIPLLQTYLGDNSIATRGTIISAFRYTLADSSNVYNDVLRPLIVPILAEMLADEDLGNHRLALTTVNSAIHNKPDLVLPHLNQLLPVVIKDTYLRPELVREVQMGPFKHKVDDGLELRKSAYETLYTCVETAHSILNIAEIYDRILAGIQDEQDIRTLCNLMVSKLITLAPKETEARLNTFCEPFKRILSTKLKESAVKQELEKAQEASLGVVKISRELQMAFPAAETSGEFHAWKQYLGWMSKEFVQLVRSVTSAGS